MTYEEPVTDNLRRDRLIYPTRREAAAIAAQSQPIPSHRAPEGRSAWPYVAGGILLAVMVVVTVIVFASPSQPAICSALDDGKGALIGAREVYGAADTSENGARILREVAVTVRQSCPEHAEEASQMDGLAGLLMFDAGT